jgi:hypothetical protein
VASHATRKYPQGWQTAKQRIEFKKENEKRKETINREKQKNPNLFEPKNIIFSDMVGAAHISVCEWRPLVVAYH